MSLASLSLQAAQASNGHSWSAGGMGFLFTLADPDDPDALVTGDSGGPLTACSGFEQPFYDIPKNSSRTTHSVFRKTAGNEVSGRLRARKFFVVTSAMAAADGFSAEG